MPAYTRDWGDATGSETLLATACRRLVRLDEVNAAGPGDVLVFRMRDEGVAKHAGILTGPSRLIHAQEGIGVVEIEALPRWYELALAERGVIEAPGAANNPIVQAYYRDAGHPEVKHDSVPWCAAFIGAMLARSGVAASGSLAARSYLNWGVKLDAPRRGCIVVLKRGKGWQGHVAFFDREENGLLVCLGGNQSNKVCFAAYRKSLLLGLRWPAGNDQQGPRAC